MTKPTDKVLAERMLRAGGCGGYRFLPFLRMNAKGYTFLVMYFGMVLAFLAFVQMWTLFTAIAGLIIGVFLRDVSWLVAVQRTWPFVTKVTDWDKVKRASDGETLA